MTVLITGCAGFIGSVVTEYFIDAGFDVVGIDDLRSSFKTGIHPKIFNVKNFFYGDYGDEDLLYDIFHNNEITHVVHLAAESIIGKAWTQPELFFSDNVVNGYTLLEAMRLNNVKNIILSSTASTYGEPEYIPMDEEHPQKPVNSYGESKLIFEQMLKWYQKAHDFRYTMFRYYNVGGSTLMNGERRKEETRLIPTIIRCMQNNIPIKIFGSDWDTPDGTCIRDYVHVADVAQAHLLATKDMTNQVYNLGSGDGYSVLEIIAMMEEVTGKKVEKEFVARRQGDPKILVASNSKAQEMLNWNPKNSTLKQICADSWRWANGIS